MKALISLTALLLIFTYTNGQTKKIELSDLLKTLIPDSVENGGMGDWNLKKPDAQTLKWTSDHLEMSDDLSINFFKKALLLVTIKGQSRNRVSPKWNLMLRGPRAGFDNFNLTSTNLSGFTEPPVLDSILTPNNYKSTLLKSCKPNAANGFYWYQIIFPKKIISYIRLAWGKNNDQYRLIIDVYDSWSMKFAHLNCN